MLIRKETDADFPGIYMLVEEAFKTAKVSNGKEQDFVTQLRNSPNYIPGLALVAEVDGTLIGHIMLTKTAVIKDDEPVETLLLAPLSVSLEHRNRGIGAQLVQEALKTAKEMGYGSVILVGEPSYYSRFGFRPLISFGIKNMNNIPDEFVLACELIPDALYLEGGIIHFEGT